VGPQGINCYNDCPISLNDWGSITGIYLDANNVYHGFLRTPDGKFTTFEAPGADRTPGSLNGTFPYGINDQGVITGYYLDANNVSHGFVRLP
jgi:cell envelope opacity-associated protein A